MIDKKNRREKTKELHNTTLSILTLAALCQKVEEPAPSHMGKGHIWKPPSKTGQEGFHRVLLNHHQVKPLPFQEHAIPLTVVFS